MLSLITRRLFGPKRCEMKRVDFCHVEECQGLAGSWAHVQPMVSTAGVVGVGVGVGVGAMSTLRGTV